MKVRLTVPVKPFTGAMVMVEGGIASPLTLVGLAVTVKSWTVKVTVVLEVVDPLVPVTMTV